MSYEKRAPEARRMNSTSERTNVDAGMELIARAGACIQSGFADRDNHPFADDFVFHYINPQLPDLHGDYIGFDGTAELFQRLEQVSETGFRNVPHSLTPYGNELLVAFATNTLSINGTEIDVDAVVVWRVVNGKIQEAWDIPAVNTVRPRPPADDAAST